MSLQDLKGLLFLIILFGECSYKFVNYEMTASRAIHIFWFG